MHIAIVEDDPQMQHHLSLLLQAWKEKHKLLVNLSYFTSGADFLKSTATEIYQMIFMDIYLSGDSGIETALKYREQDLNSILIFLTSSTDHMRDAFPCRAFDYLLKPVKDQELFHTLDEALRSLRPQDRVLQITNGKNQYSVRYGDIRYAISQRNYCLIQTEELLTYRTTFRSLTQELETEPCFCLINRGILVNLNWVESFQNGECLMVDGTVFPLHNRKQSQLLQILIDYRFQKRDEHIRRIWND